MIQTVLIGHHLSPAASDGTADGGVFICNSGGQARDFKTIPAAESHIRTYDLNKDGPIWNIFLLIEVPVNVNQ